MRTKLFCAICLSSSLRVTISNVQMASRKPKLIVFDLDYTLWPFWVDTHVNPPFRKGSTGNIVDSYGSKIKYYPEVPEVLKNLDDEGYILGVASRTGEIQGARQLINLFGWDQYFSYKEIFPGNKVKHFQNIKKQSHIEYSEMLFFDDEQRNIKAVSELGVLSIFVRDGVSKEVIEEGKRLFANSLRAF